MRRMFITFVLLLTVGCAPAAINAQTTRPGKLLFWGRYEGTNTNGIFTIDTDGRNLQQIDKKYRSSYSPRWSPDGTRIAFTGSSRSLAIELSIYDLKASSVR